MYLPMTEMAEQKFIEDLGTPQQGHKSFLSLQR